LNRQSRYQAEYDDEKRGRWTKVDGKWCFVKDSSCEEISKAKVSSNSNSTVHKSVVFDNPIKATAPTVTSPVLSAESTTKQARHDAAQQVQKIFRGYRQRRFFRVLVLQHHLDTMEQRTEDAIAEIRAEVEVRKEKYYNKMRLQARKELAAIDEEKALVFDAKQTINRLRAENKKLRKEAEQLREEMIDLKAANENLEKVNDVVADTFAQLEKEVANIHKAHDALQKAVPEYRQAVEKLESEAELRHQYVLAEQGVKLRYMTVIGLIVDSIQEDCKQAKLVDEIVGYALEVDSKFNSDAKP
jgi:chromosome segregation ATPase